VSVQSIDWGVALPLLLLVGSWTGILVYAMSGKL
jgi:hypothetical protein